MTPNKYKDFVSAVAEKMSLSEELVEDIISFYWKEIRRQLDNPEELELNLRNFGRFIIRPKHLFEQIKTYRSIVENAKPRTYAAYTILEITRKKLEGLEKLAKLYEAQEAKRKLKKEQRNAQAI